MTQRIELQPIPNQSFTLTLDNDRYELTIKESRGTVAADLIRDEVSLYRGLRIVAGTPLIPYTYRQTGNFIITTENGEIPYYTRFGITQFLIYASPAELEGFRRG